MLPAGGRHFDPALFQSGNRAILLHCRKSRYDPARLAVNNNRGAAMNKLAKIMLAAGAVLAMATTQAAGISLNAVRVGAKDVATVAKFYQTAFGMHEVQRITGPNMLEIMLNFGATPEAAKANTGSQVVIMSRAADDGVDKLAHVIFTVTDAVAVAKAAKAAGATMEREPFEYNKTGIWIAMLIDPAGNHIELLQYAAAK
jgi:predicted enzyme related to lactoylglutathione lyase